MIWLEVGNHYWLTFLLRPSSFIVNLIVFHGFTLLDVMIIDYICLYFGPSTTCLEIRISNYWCLTCANKNIWGFVVFFYIILLSLSESLDILRLFAADAPKLLLMVYLSLWSTAICWRHWDAGTYLVLSTLSFVSLSMQFLQCCWVFRFSLKTIWKICFNGPFRYHVVVILL